MVKCDKKKVTSTQGHHFAVTGFSSFPGVPANPTEALISRLSHPLMIDSRVLSVSAEATTSYARELPAICVDCDDVVCLHFGVSSLLKRGQFRLERTAYNEATFRVPDVCGWSPSGECISKELPLSQPVRTALDLDAIVDELRGEWPQVAISDDPGRYLCNHIYFLSLGCCKEKGKGAPRHSLFVHVPPHETPSCPQEHLKFANDLIDAINKRSK